MTFTLIADPPPLEINTDNVVLVGKTRVTLDTVVTVFKQGTTAEEIVHRYPALNLADVYATIAFYLNHQQADLRDDFICEMLSYCLSNRSVHPLNQQQHLYNLTLSSC